MERHQNGDCQPLETSVFHKPVPINSLKFSGLVLIAVHRIWLELMPAATIVSVQLHTQEKICQLTLELEARIWPLPHGNGPCTP
jgi:hypothetical protein